MPERSVPEGRNIIERWDKWDKNYQEYLDARTTLEFNNVYLWSIVNGLDTMPHEDRDLLEKTTKKTFYPFHTIFRFYVNEWPNWNDSQTQQTLMEVMKAWWLTDIEMPEFLAKRWGVGLTNENKRQEWGPNIKSDAKNLVQFLKTCKRKHDSRRSLPKSESIKAQNSRLYL